MTHPNEPDAPPLPPGLLTAVRAQVERSPSPTRAAMRRRQATVAVACIGLATVVFLAYGGLRDGGAPRPAALMVATLLGSALITGLTVIWSFGQRAARWGIRRSRLLPFAALIGVPLALFAWKIGCSALFEGGLAEWPDRVGIPCVQIGMLTGAGPLAAGLWLRWRSEPHSPGLLGAHFGLAAGACAWWVTDLWCPVGHVPHLMVGHVLPLLLLMGAGAALGARLLGIRWSPKAG